MQDRYATFKRAAAFYDKQMLDHLNPLMREYIAEQEMAFIATADANGEADASFRAGPPGFMRVLDEKTLMYPEYRGNGVMASLGNISENGHVGILFVDFFRSTVGLHVNGTARIVENDAVSALASVLERMAGVTALHEQVADKKKTPERWVVVEVVEAYIHCSKHIPLFQKLDKDIDWGTDSEVRKGGDYFKAKHDPRPWATPAAPKSPRKPAAEPASPVLSCDVPAVGSSASEPVADAAPAPEPVAAEAPAAAEPSVTPEPPVAAVAAAQPRGPIPEALPPLETTDPDRAAGTAAATEHDDEDFEFPIAGFNGPAQAEKFGFGPEIALEEARADDDRRAAVAEHSVEDEDSDDLLDLWVLPDWRPAVRV